MKLLENFLDFFKNNNMYATVVGTVLSMYIHDCAQSLTNDIIIPIIDRDIDNDGKPDINIIKNYQLNIMGTKLRVGNFLVHIIKVLIIVVLIFCSNYFVLKK